MKEYPSIPGAKANNLPCVAFKKYDGSNMRFLWQKKKGWVRYGTRRRLIDKLDEEYGEAVTIFQKEYAEGIEKVLLTNKDFRGCTEAIAYCEFFGPHSFAGWHKVECLQSVGINVEHNDPKQLMLFDVNIHKKGIIGPRAFLDAFGDLRIPEVMYQGFFTEEFIKDVREGKYGDAEGVVCKGGNGHSLWFCKVKTLAYLKLLKERFGVGYSQYWE